MNEQPNLVQKNGYAPCAMCGTQRPKDQLCPVVLPGKKLAHLACVDVQWCSKQARKVRR